MIAQVIGIFIGIFIVILVAFSIYPTLVSTIEQSSNLNATGATENMIQFVPVMFVAIVVSSVIGMTYHVLSDVGLIGTGVVESEESEESEEPIKKPRRRRKQTYEEYVRERLEVERMMK